MGRKTEDEQMAEIKRILDIEDKDIAEWFGYKTRAAYQQSSGKRRIEAGIKKVWARLGEKLLFKPQ